MRTASSSAPTTPVSPECRPRRGWPALLAISRSAKQSQPVFIVGEARSGSTILYRVLLRHPLLRPTVENLQESSFIAQAPDAATFNDNAPRNLRRFMLEDDVAWADFRKSLDPVRGWLRLVDRLSESWQARWTLGPTKLVARSYLFHSRVARGCGRILEKTPAHIEHVDRLLGCFPRARILYITRHPVDVYSSYVRRGQVDAKAEWARIGVDEFCRLYEDRSCRALEAVRRFPAWFRLIRYHEFTRSPETELALICQFIDVDFDPNMLSDLRQPGRWAHWEQSSLVFDEIKEETKDWRDYLSPAEAALLQTRLGRVMSDLGHAPYDVWSAPAVVAGTTSRTSTQPTAPSLPQVVSQGSPAR